MIMKNTALLLSACLLTGCATSAQRATRQRLSRIVVPEVEFRQAHITAVADFLAGFADPNPPPPENRSIGLAISLTSPGESPPPEPDFSAAPAGDPIPSITIMAKQIPFLDLLEIVCREADLTYRIDRNGHLVFKRTLGPTSP